VRNALQMTGERQRSIEHVKYLLTGTKHFTN